MSKLVNTALLSILIPTYNRPNHIKALVQSFIQNRDLFDNSTISFVISENLNSSKSQVHESVSMLAQYFNVRLVNPESHLVTAEENLFFGWQFTTGDYVWILGDDDPVNFEVFLDLLSRCEKRNAEILKYNAFVYYGNEIGAGNLVTKSVVAEMNKPMRDFLQLVGFWHTGAGFSTWVFKRTLIDPIKGLLWVQSFRSPIYSHVTYFLHSCHSHMVTFVNKPLVNYRVNDYVYKESEGDNHWTRYTKAHGMPRYFPWTLGFVEQLTVLYEDDIISHDYWGAVIGDHFGSPRFLEFNSMVSLAIRQLFIEFQQVGLSFSRDEWRRFLDFCSNLRPGYHHIWKLFQFCIDSCEPGTRRGLRNVRRLYLSWLMLVKFDEFGYFRENKMFFRYKIPNQTVFVAKLPAEIKLNLYLGHSSSNQVERFDAIRNLMCGFYHIRIFLANFFSRIVRYMPMLSIEIAIFAVKSLRNLRNSIRKIRLRFS